jgi:DNA-binding XRE family transcriptional regulator
MSGDRRANRRSDRGVDQRVSSVLVVGGPDFADNTFITGILDRVHERFRISALISERLGPTGLLASRWARANGIAEHTPFEVEADPYSRSLTLARRTAALLATKPDLVVVFPGDEETAHIRASLEKARLPVFSPIYWQQSATYPGWR